MSPRLPTLMPLLALLLIGGCASLPPGAHHDPRDRFERFNRSVFSFNQSLDKHVARPVAVAYVKVTPQPVRSGVANFFDNFGYPVVIVNELLQAKPKLFARDTARLVVNTTIGIGGLFDPASKMGLAAHDEDLGQTFGYWGMPPGPYLMLPVLGPSTARDTTGKVGDYFVEPKNYLSTNILSWGYSGGELLSKRAELLDADAALSRYFDQYAFVRSAYLQRRQFQVYDGNPPEEPLPEEDTEDSPAADKPSSP